MRKSCADYAACIARLCIGVCRPDGSEGAYQAHLRRLFDRPGVASCTELATRALRDGWLEVPTHWSTDPVVEGGIILARAGSAAGRGRLEGGSIMARIRETLRLNWAPLLIAFGGVAVLLALSGRYGLHRDELYFIVAGRHPDFGYVDQPLITPLLTAASAAIFGVSATAVRILPALAYAAIVLLAAAIAREFGGDRRAQAIASLVVAVSGLIEAGHLSSTSTYDLLGWTVFLFIAIRALNGGDQRLWLLAGLAAGIALENKPLILFLGAGFAAGVVIARRWELLRSRWVWLGMALAFVIWLPNLAWQAAHDWPQLDMARSIAENSGAENRSQLILLQIIFAGPLLFPVLLAGLWWLLRAPQAKPWRAVGWSYLVILVLVYVVQGKGYYTGGLMPALIAAGAIVTAAWLDRGRLWLKRLKLGISGLATAASAAVVAVLLLPVIPPADFPSSAAADANADLVSQYGWDSFVTQVQAVTDSLPPDDRRHAAIVTGNYGEAGALELLSKPGLPPVYSGHNSYSQWGPPPDSVTVAIMVYVSSSAGAWSSWLGPCELAATIDLGFPRGVSEEQGAGVWVCRYRQSPWGEIWPQLRHYD
jgi:4-amino-4-deoxy-L-arabinose transferase-like glycosyltransferase